MSERARDFVESWKEEHLDLATCEEEALTQSMALAEACYEAAAEAGIPKEEIDREYEDLASDIAAALETQTSGKTDRLAQTKD
jgi:hypothetical protein